MRRLLTIAAVIAALGAVPATALAAGVTGPAIYVNGVLYRTVGTPTDFSGTGAPAASYDVIYDLGGLQPSVATAAPGDPGFNGGRWKVHALSFSNYAAAVAAADANQSGDLDSAAEVHTALTLGLATDLGVVKTFECPVIPLPRGH